MGYRRRAFAGARGRRLRQRSVGRPDDDDERRGARRQQPPASAARLAHQGGDAVRRPTDPGGLTWLSANPWRRRRGGATAEGRIVLSCAWCCFWWWLPRSLWRWAARPWPPSWASRRSMA